MDNIVWKDRVGNGVLRRGGGDRNVINTVKGETSDWIDHILLRNCLLKHAVEGKMQGRLDVPGRPGR